jgi:hypothetical protein
VLYKVTPPARTTTQIIGLYDDPTNPWSQSHVTWRRSDCRGGTLTVRVSSDTQLFRGVVQTLTIDGTTPAQTLHLAPNTSRRLIRLPLSARDGVCRVDFSISPTRRPIDFPRLHLRDSRSLGLHFELPITYTPPR